MAPASPRTLRILISSPGDVAAERDKARAVIATLQRQYGDALRLVPILWEDLPLPASASFQDGIDLVLSREHGIDIAVFILWSRLGSPLGPGITKTDGIPYRSGTEREFDLMMEACRRSGGSRPHVLAYVRQDDDGFRRRLLGMPDDALLTEVQQKRAAQEFIVENFQDAETRTNLRAYHTYPEPVTFARRLQIHLRELIDTSEEGLSGALVRWEGEPYRAFEAFELEHAEIFHGRDAASADLEALLRRRADLPFVVVVGPSGSGKSSLVRAGLASILLRSNFDPSVAAWRWCALIPGDCQGNVVAGLAEALTRPGALPELLEAGVSAPALAEGLLSAGDATLAVTVEPALRRAADLAGGTVRLLVIVDQLEELYTDVRVSAPERAAFYRTLRALAATGCCWIVATLRGDYYGVAQQDRDFLELKGSDGQFDLLPPEPSALRRIIVEPARLAGLQFERDDRSGRSLDQLLLDDAAAHPDALPLLEFTLHELYKGRRDRILTFECYAALGGLAGAVGRRAEEVFASLPTDARAAFPKVMQRLVALRPETGFTPFRVRATYDRDELDGPDGVLIRELTAARLLTSGAAGDHPTVTLAHEALLQSWERLSRWVKDNHHHLRIRARIDDDRRHWDEQGREDSLLLPAGLPLQEGTSLLADAPHLVNRDLGEYIEASRRCVEQSARRASRHRRVVMAALGILALAAILAAAWALVRGREAVSQRVLAERRLAAASFREAVAQSEADETSLALAHVARALRLTPESAPARALAADLIMHARRPLSVIVLEDGVEETAWSPDGSAVVVSSRLGKIRGWDTRSGAPLGPIAGFAEYPNEMAWSPDGTRVAVRRSDVVFVWDPRGASGPASILENCLPAGFTIARGSTLGWAADGARLAAGKGSSVCIWDAQSGKVTQKIAAAQGKEVQALAWHPDGARIAVGGGPLGSGEGAVELFDARTGRRVRRPLPHKAAVTLVAWQSLRWAGRDGYALLSRSGLDLTIWNAETGASVPVGPVDGSVFLSPDGRRLAVAEDDSAWLRDFLTDLMSGGRLQHDGRVVSVGWTSDGRGVLTASADGTARIWSAAGYVALGMPAGIDDRPHYHPDNFTLKSLWSPKGTTILARKDQALARWDPLTGNISDAPLSTLGSSFLWEASWSPSGRWLAVSTLQSAVDASAVRVVEVETGREAQLAWVPGSIVEQSWSPDEQNLAVAFSRRGGRQVDVLDTGGLDSTVGPPDPSADRALPPDTASEGGWSAANPRPQAEVECGPLAQDSLKIRHTLDIAWSAAESRLLTASACDQLVIWAWTGAGGWSEVRRFDTKDLVLERSFVSGNAKDVATTTYDGRVVIWDMSTGTRLDVLGHGDAVASLAWSPDGSMFATGSLDGTAKLWTRDGRPVGGPLVHGDDVTHVSWSPDGAFVATASADATARVWDARTGLPVGAPRLHSDPVQNVTWSPTGRQFATVSEERVRLWDFLVPEASEATALADLAEWIGGLRIGEDTLTLPLDWPSRASALRVLRNARRDDAPNTFDQFVRWLLEDPADRTASPMSRMTVNEYIDRMLAFGERGRAELELRVPYALEARGIPTTLSEQAETKR